MELKKSLTIPGTLMTALSSMIGSGWLFSSMIGAQLAGPSAIIAWVIGAIMIIFIALSFAELSASLPLTGSIARYGQITHGPIVGFIISWLAWLSCVAVAPTEVQASITYASYYFHGLSYIHQGNMSLTALGYTVAVLLMLVFSIINFFGVLLVARINNILCTWKIIIPTLTGLLIILYHHQTDHLYAYGGFFTNGYDGIFSCISTIVVFSFLGFREATDFGEEIAKPHIAIPVAVIGSVLFCALFYVFLQYAFIVSIPDEWLAHGWNEIKGSEHLAPFIGISASIGLGLWSQVVLLDSVITPSSAVLIYSATTSRIAYAMSLNKLLPQSLQKLNRFGIPHHAILLNFIVGCLLFLPLPSWELLLQFQSTAMIIAYLIGPVALICFRHADNDFSRPFKLPQAHLIAQITFFICTLIIFWTGWHANILLLIFTMGGLGFYALLNQYASNKLNKKDFSQAIWLIGYLLIVNAICYLNTMNMLNLTSTYCALLVVSVIGFECAIRMACNKEAIAKDIQALAPTQK